MIALATFTQCKKDGDDDNDGDLTTDIVGRYDNVADNNLVILVSKVDEETVSIAMNSDAGSSSLDFTFSNTKMNSKTSFTLSEIKENGSIGGENYVVTYSGQGTISGNNISISIRRVQDYDVSTDFESTETYIATKTN